MASNPLYNTNDSPNGATQPSKAVNDSQVFVNRNRNTFDLSYFNYKTQRFGQYEPFFVMEGVPGDTIPLSSSHNVRSLPMKSPFLSSLTLSKDYFMVPMQAILPNTWELIFSNPASGDDVPDDANCIFDLFRVSLFANISDQFRNDTYIKIAFLLESVFSSASLPAQLGFTMQETLNPSTTSFDHYFDTFVRSLYESNTELSFTYPDNSKKSISKSSVPSSVFVDFLRQNYIYLTSSSVDVRSSFKDTIQAWYSENDYFLQVWSSTYFNISRILAYQICCHQFYVNTKIDPIYNAQLYRDNFFYLLKNVFISRGTSLSYESFTRNGINVPYDFFSKHYFDKIWLGPEENLTDTYISSIIDLYFYLFSFQRVLKFGDYFTASRTQPLGTDVNGQMNAPVVGNEVAAIDMSKSIVMQRFLNNVVKLGNDFGEYLRGIFGREPSPDYHFPKFIAHQEFDVSGFEVANSTESGQGSMVTNLQSGSDKYAFEVTVDMPCILLGISNFNCPRLYGNARPRFLFHKDRFDMFNPMLQYIGDQPLHRIELSTDSEGEDEVFGYNSRNSEYKQAFSVASGGFLYELPSWSFIADFGPDYAAIPSQHQGPDFIRVYPFEFDRFFATLSGLSLSQAFHFIVVYNNKVMASRPMAVNPSIL